MAVAKLDIYQMAGRHLAEQRFALITDDVETRYAFDDAWDRAVDFVLREGAWRHALKTVALSSSGSPATGYANSFAFPTDWLRTHAIFISTADGRECSLDLRQNGILISTNIAAPIMRYVSTDYRDPSLANHPWPEHFAECVAVYLAFLAANRVTGDRAAPARMSQIFSSILPEALALDALPEDRWLPHQFNGAYLTAARQVLRLGDWRFALQDTAPSPSGTPVNGFSNAFPQPASWMRTHKLYVAAGTRECPLDIREQGGFWSANSAFIARFVSSGPGLDSTLWPETFKAAVLAYLEFTNGSGEGAEARNKAWQERLKEALDTSAEPENPWLRFQLSGAFHRASREVLSQGFWRFAAVTATPSTGGSAAAGYANSYVQPTDLLLLHALYLSDATGKEYPLDVRDQDTHWSTNITGLKTRYVSTAGLDSILWPEPFRKTVLAFLEVEEAGEGAQRDGRPLIEVYRQLLADGLQSHGLAPDQWLPAQLDGTFLRAARQVGQSANWQFALKDAAPPATGGTALAGFANSYAIPTDWLKTHKLFAVSGVRECPIDAREQGANWSSNSGSAFIARYVSTIALDSTLWPDPYRAAVWACIEFFKADPKEAGERAQAWQKLLADASAEYAVPEDSWLRFQLDGSFLRAAREVLSHGPWRFAIVTATPSTGGSAATGYTNSFVQPTDLLRTHALYLSDATGKEYPFDARDQDTHWSANVTGIKARYVSSVGLDATLWPEPFSKSVMAFLEAEEAGEGAQRDGRPLYQIYQELLATGLQSHGLQENPWFQAQLDGSFHRASREVLNQGFWRFATVTAAPSTGGTPATGYANSYVQPTDLLRTHALYLSDASGKEYPLDVRDQDTHWSTNITGLKVRYVSTGGMSALLWPEPFSNTVMAFLRTERAEEGAQRLYQELLEIALSSHGLQESPWLSAQLDGSFLRAARQVGQSAFWRFAMKDASPSVGGTPLAGFTNSYTIPTDWLRTHKIFTASLGRECPIDAREQGSNWSSNTAFTARYVSTQALDSTLWPDPYRDTVRAYIEFMRADPKEAAEKAQTWQKLLADASAEYADRDSPWLAGQLDGAFYRVARDVAFKGFWRCGLTATHVTVIGGVGIGGYDNYFTPPTEIIRTRALYLLTTDGRKVPFDVREWGGRWYSSRDSFYAQYVSATLILDAARWPDHYSETVLRYLQLDQAIRAGNEQAIQVARASAEAAFAVAVAEEIEPDDPWLMAQFDGTFARVSREMPSQGFWRFATKIAGMTTIAGGSGSLARHVDIPADWLSTRSLFVMTADTDQRRPFDVREQAGRWYADEADFSAEYVASDLALDSTLWPDLYSRAVQRQIEFDRATRTDMKDQQVDAAVWKAALQEALIAEAIPEDPWLEHQLNGNFTRARPQVITRGNWKFALKTKEYSPDLQSSDPADNGFPYRFDLPDDWLKTHALYVPFGGTECPFDARETRTYFSTATDTFTARYVTKAALDAKLWPEPVARAVLSYLEWQDMNDEPQVDPRRAQGSKQLAEGAYEKQLSDALRDYSLEDDPWLRFQLDGRYFQGVMQVLSKARWRFAINTVTLTDSTDPNAVSDDPAVVSPGYTYRFNKPTDWVRTLWVYRSLGEGIFSARQDIEFRDELDAFHTNYTPIILRYLTRLGLDATRWPANFRDAVLALLQYLEMRADPKMASVAAAKFKFFEEQCGMAETLDDVSDMPRVINASRFVAGRRGRGNFNREQAWPPQGW